MRTGVEIMSLSAVAVSADGNTQDTLWSYSCQNASSNTEWRRKYNDSYVYCKPTSGYATYVTVKGADNDSGSGSGTYSLTFNIPIGTKGFISNYVNENGKKYARLYLQRTVMDNTICQGKWSPDSVWESGGTIYH